MRDIVLTSEILTLPDMAGYLMIPGDYPIARVSYDYVPVPKIAQGFVEREGFGIIYVPKTGGDTDDPLVPDFLSDLGPDEFRLTGEPDRLALHGKSAKPHPLADAL